MAGFDTSVFRQQWRLPETQQNALLRGLETQRAQQGNALQSMQLQALMQRQQQEQAAQAKMQQFVQGLPSPRMQASQNALAGGGGPTVANAQRMAPVDPRLQMQYGAMQAGLMSPMDYLKSLHPEQKLQAVGMDQNIVDMNAGGAVVRAGQAKPAPKPSAVQEFEYAQTNPAFDSWNRTNKKAGATNLSVNTEKSYGGEIAQGLAKADLAALDVARSAPDRIRSAADVKRILSTGNPITGTAAEQRLWLDKALSTAGVIDGTRTQATEDLVNLLANQTLDAIKTSGLGSGQGFTDKDRQFLQDAKAGRIEINAKTLYRMADLNEKSARASIAYGNKVAARLKGNPILGTVGQDLEVQAPVDLNEAIAAEAARRGLGGK